MTAEPQFLLDSNICIYLLDGNHPRLRARIEAADLGSMVTSTIAMAEVIRGIAPSDAAALDRAAAFFQLIPALPFDTAAALAYAGLPFKRRSFDRLIAAHALALNLIVVTANAPDFSDIIALSIEDWTGA